MAKIYVMQTGRTAWDEQARVESSHGAPLSQAGRQEAVLAAQELVGQPISAVYASAGQSEQETAGIAAEALGVKVRTRKDLGEIDYGLWQGLTIEEIKHRQPKLYRQWTEAPASVRPPGGETLGEVQHRLRNALREILRRGRRQGRLLVLRPVALGLIQCLARHEPPAALWQHVGGARSWAPLDIDEDILEEG